MDRPSLPDPSLQYQKDRAFILYENKPPSKPPGEWRSMRFSRDDLDLEMHPNGRLENCRRHTVHPPTDRPSFSVRLEQPLAAGLADLRYAQVWKVACLGKTMVARFYDPLYVHDNTGRYDIFQHIDNSIANEAQAYNSLQDLQGVLVPRFIGCFLTMMPPPDDVENSFERSVQVVLLEFIPGCSLRSLSLGDSHPVCEMHKDVILDVILVAYHLIVLCGIQHLDMADRNLILKECPFPPSKTAFCSYPACQLRFKLPTKSLLQEFNPSGGPAFDYSTLTLEQIESLPVAVIDFGDIGFLEDKIAEREKLIAIWGCGDSFSRKYLEDISRPENWRENFLQLCDWCASGYAPM